MKSMLVCVLLGFFTLNLASCLPSPWILDNPLPAVPAQSKLLMPVRLGDGKLRERRQALAKTQPIRILPVYADNFVTNLQGKASLVQGEIIPKLLGFLSESLMVAPLTEPILLNNECTTNLFIPGNDGDITCVAECAATTMCGGFPVPTEHLKQCRQCNGDTSNCGVGTPAQDGAGVSDHDFILYIMADQSTCPTSNTGSPTTLAFASSCQTEQAQDRPIAGFVNFCPNAVRDRDSDFAFTVTKHEVLHAMGFSRSLMSLWRDENNMPRTPRNSFGLPNINSMGMFEVSTSTIDTVTYTDWLTASGRISHTVSRLVTPAVRREARSHFDCSTLAGVELENQGGSGTALSHWEKRVLGNEGMTGILTFNAVFSRFTFAALEDSGWYAVNYSNAEELIWGRDAGCRFAEGSCGEWIQTQTNNNEPLSPFCNMPETNPLRTSCTVDHEAVSKCNIATFTSALPTEFQYFPTPETGGSLTVADFCPFQDVFSFRQADNSLRGTTCSVSSNAPDQNNLLETYGPGSRCVTHGRQWTLNGQNIPVYGGGCYQYSCSGDAVTITIDSTDFVCSCSQAGQEMVVDLTVNNLRYQGSIVCPSCTQICHVPSRNIATKPPPISTTTGSTSNTGATPEPTVGGGTTATPSASTDPTVGGGTTATPSASTDPPSSTPISTPSVDTPTPSVDTPTPSVDTPTPSVETPTPSVDTPTPSVDMPTSSVTPSVSTPAPGDGATTDDNSLPGSGEGSGIGSGDGSGQGTTTVGRPRSHAGRLMYSSFLLSLISLISCLV